MGFFKRRGDVIDRAVDLLGPFADRGALRGWAAELLESARVRRASRLPGRLRRRLDTLERARANAVLARIASTTGERDALVHDADLYAGHLVRDHFEAGGPSFPFLFAVGPVGTDGVFRAPRRDVDAFAGAAPDHWKAVRKAVHAWTHAPLAVKRESVGIFVLSMARAGELVMHRRRPAPSDEERVDGLLRMLDGREPAAVTDGELTVSLCDAYRSALGCMGEVAEVEGDRDTRRDA
jgi:hypothetical protein